MNCLEEWPCILSVVSQPDEADRSADEASKAVFVVAALDDERLQVEEVPCTLRGCLHEHPLSSIANNDILT